ncbi:MAG TPA: glycosyltransferase, partial [Nitriliruptorales bacterium]
MATSRPAPDAHLGPPTSAPSPTRVLWLVKGLGPGGAERLLTLMARRRDRSRVAVRAAYLLPHKVALVPDLEAESLRVECVGRSRLMDLRWLATLRRSLVHDPVDVVHAHSPVAAVAARLVVRSLPRRKRPRMVTTDHSLWDGHVR